MDSRIPCSVLVCWCQDRYGQNDVQRTYCLIKGALQVQGLSQFYIHKSVHPVTRLFVYTWPPSPSTCHVLQLSPAFQRRRNGSKEIVSRSVKYRSQLGSILWFIFEGKSGFKSEIMSANLSRVARGFSQPLHAQPESRGDSSFRFQHWLSQR